MNPEDHSLLQRTYKLAQENNDMLRSIRRANRISLIIRGVYWVLIITLAIGAYYVIQPYVDYVLNFFRDNNEEARNSAEILRNMFNR